ncbi:hypothetical protein QTP88_020307 [Uroleucon formosanum]
MKDTIFLLKQKRTHSDVVFQQLFSESKVIFKQLDVEIRLPRIVPRQKHRENYQPGQTAEEYFRKSIYIPLLDAIIADLEERLSPEVLSLFNLGVFLPKTVYSEVDLVAVREAVKNYTELLHGPHISTVLSEFQLWVTKWKREVESGNKVPEFLPQCALPVMSLRVGVENDKDASNVILTGKWSESSSKSGSWCMEKRIDFNIITSKISGLLL